MCRRGRSLAPALLPVVIGGIEIDRSEKLDDLRLTAPLDVLAQFLRAVSTDPQRFFEELVIGFVAMHQGLHTRMCEASRPSPCSASPTRGGSHGRPALPCLLGSLLANFSFAWFRAVIAVAMCP